MRDIPIIFSAPMVLALLDGRKTMTRRLLYSKRKARNGIIPASATMLQDHPPPCLPLGAHDFPTDIGPDEYYTLSPWQRVKPGDRLWVRENLKCAGSGIWRYASHNVEITMARSDPRVSQMIAWAHHEERGAVPSIHMPRWASRLTLVVSATKIERLQGISAADVAAEGVKIVNQGGVTYGVLGDQWTSPRRASRLLWCSLHGDNSWT